MGRQEGQLQLVFCYNARDETGALGLVEKREREGLLAAYLFFLAGMHYVLMS